MIKEIQKGRLKVKVHDEYGLFGRGAWKKHLLSKKDVAALFRFAKLDQNKPQDMTESCTLLAY